MIMGLLLLQSNQQTNHQLLQAALCLRLLLMSDKSQAKFLWFSFVSHMPIISLSCWTQRKRMVRVIRCNLIAVLLVLGFMVLC